MEDSYQIVLKIRRFLKNSVAAHTNMSRFILNYNVLHILKDKASIHVTATFAQIC